MKEFFGKKVASITSHTIGKADKKKFNAVIPNALDVKQEYKLIHASNKAKVIKQDGIALYFQYHNQTFPTIKNFRKDVFKSVRVDTGVLGPLSRGADIMAPGILKFVDTCPNFDSGEILGVDVDGNGICAIGIATLSLEEMKKVREGIAIDVMHVKGDALDRGII